MSITSAVTGGKAWKKTLEKVAKLKVKTKVGIFDESTGLEGESVATYAMYNEFGTQNIPPRPFMRNSVSRHSREWSSIISRYASANPDDIVGGFELAGEVASKDMQAMIEGGKFIDNAESTIEAKKRRGKQNPNTPLIDTGTMQESITYEVERS